MLLAISDSQNWLLRRFAALASADDQALRWLVRFPCLHAFLVAPRVDDVASTARTTTMRVIDGIHDFTAYLGSLAEPTALASLTVRQKLVLGVANSANGRQTIAVHHARFGGGHTEGDIVAFLCHDLERGSRRTSHLTTLSRLELDVVDVGAERDLLERDRITNAAIGARTGYDLVPD